MKQLSDYIQVVPSVLTTKQCSEIIRTLNKVKFWEPTTVKSADVEIVEKRARNCDVTYVSIHKATNAALAHVDGLLFNAAGLALVEYQNKVKADACVSMDTGYDALRYKKGGFYVTHTDSFSKRPRAISCSFALNDNYEGGEWGFFGEEIKIKAPVGSAVLFPSNFCFPHQILPVTKGTRYSVVTWFQ